MRGINLAVKARLTREKIAESKAVEVVSGATKKSVGTMTEMAGFLSWNFGRIFRPVVRRVRQSYAQYRSELNNKE